MHAVPPIETIHTRRVDAPEFTQHPIEVQARALVVADPHHHGSHFRHHAESFFGLPEFALGRLAGPLGAVAFEAESHLPGYVERQCTLLLEGNSGRRRSTS